MAGTANDLQFYRKGVLVMLVAPVNAYTRKTNVIQTSGPMQSQLEKTRASKDLSLANNTAL